jgi:methylase of polypeptide subunit release factors
VGASSTGAGPGPPDVGDRAAVAELRRVLAAAGLSGEGVRAALGENSELLAGAHELAVHERRLAGVEPLGPIVRLFVLGRPVAAAEVERALAPLDVARLERMRLVESDGTAVRALARIVPHDELLIASDRQQPDDSRADHVAGVQGPSLTLSHLTVRRPVESALDVGTGSGIQALLAARHAGRVVATDLNERALAFAAFNALLNGVDNVELRAGSFFEPVRGERFGLVTCNPPYVISPESAFMFRDGGLEGDAVSREVVRALPAHLEEGAFASALVSWAHAPGEDWSAPLRAWLDGSGCDAWLLHRGTDDPLAHAASWNRGRTGGAEEVGKTLDRWLAYLERLGIAGIAYGAAILRRRSGAGPNWVRADDLPAERLRSAGAHVLRVFEAADFLAGLADERELLAEPLALAPAAVLEQRAVLRDGDWTLAEITLRLEEGVSFRAGLDAGIAGLLAGLDGRRPLGQAVDELAATRGLDRDALAREAAAVVREMLAAGFLVRGAPAS